MYSREMIVVDPRPGFERNQVGAYPSNSAVRLGEVLH